MKNIVSITIPLIDYGRLSTKIIASSGPAYVTKFMIYPLQYSGWEIKGANSNSSKIIEKIGILFKAEFESAGIRFKINFGNAPETFQADIDLLEQVFINLIRNAADAVNGETEPEINLVLASRTDGKLSVIVEDNGIGIPARQMDRIFVPFYSTKENGSGIGLSLSRQIILMHHGSITASSTENKGSSFEIII